jgi:hypothetical protein
MVYGIPKISQFLPEGQRVVKAKNEKMEQVTMRIHTPSLRLKNILNRSPPIPPSGDCVETGENAVIPTKAGNQIFEIVVVSNRLDARFRGHDELAVCGKTQFRQSLRGAQATRQSDFL